jgi:hypothetical protein
LETGARVDEGMDDYAEDIEDRETAEEHEPGLRKQRKISG